MSKGSRYSIQSQAAEARRQMAMMRGVYPDMVKAGVIDQATLDLDLNLFAALVETIEWVAKYEGPIRAAVKASTLPGHDGAMSTAEAHRLALNEAAEHVERWNGAGARELAAQIRALVKREQPEGTLV